MNLPQTTADMAGYSCVYWAKSKSIARAQLGKEGGNVMLVSADFLVFPLIYPCARASGCLPRPPAPSPQPAPSRAPCLALRDQQP